MNQIIKRIGIALFFLLILAYVIYQISRGFTQPYTTEVALSYVASDSAPTTCLLVRTETVLNQSGKGVIEHLYPDGEKVAKGETVAYIYSSEDQVRNKTRISDLQREIEVLNQSGDMNSTGLVQADLLVKRISQQMTNLVSFLDSGDGRNADDAKYELQISLNKKKIITNEPMDFSSRLDELNTELGALSRDNSSQSMSSVVSPISGYYVGSVDGYEEILTVESLDSFSLSQFDEMMAQEDEPADTESGKVISGLEWYCVASGDLSLAQRLSKGMSVDIVFPFSSREVPGELVSFQEYPEENRVLMIFSCTNMSEDIASARKTSADITFRSYSGIRVRQEAIRFDEENNEGVYVRVGEKVVFKKLDVLYRGDGFVLSNVRDSSESQYLKLFDEIIIEGKDLYDGKILQ